MNNFKNPEVVFRIRYWDHNVRAEREVTLQELRKCNVGDIFTVDVPAGACDRNVHYETHKVIYKVDEGVAFLSTLRRTTDSPEPKEIKKEKWLRWCSFTD